MLYREKNQANMVSMKHNFWFIFCFLFISSFVATLPIVSKDDPLSKFVEFLKQNNCSMPTAVVLPFSATDSSPFSYLFTPLKECQSPEAVLENSEANLLCRETFDVLQNITCNDFSSLPKINSSYLSTNVCGDFAAVQDILPKQKDYLSGKLGDGVVCQVLCTGRYELLCKTLLWSYDTQATLKKTTNSKRKETLIESINEIPHESDLNVKKTEENGEEDLKEANEIPDKNKAVSYSEETKELTSKSPSNDGIPQTLPMLNSSKDGTANISQTIQNVLSSTQKSVSSSELPDTNVGKEKSSGESSKAVKNVTQVNDSTPENVDTENRVSNASSVTVVVNENNAKSGTTIKSNENSEIPIVPETEIESGVNNVGLQEPSENETKKPAIVTESNLLSSTDKNEDIEPHPDVKDTELYNDSENDGDYPKQEYDSAFSPSLKKDSDIKTVDDVSNHISSNSGIRISSETFLPGRNYLPEQEDSHFFFYFLSIVLILMAGYLVFHNKQKIIALIVEGRHERRRRSHGAGYKKLDTK
jgi:hypothetical protein